MIITLLDATNHVLVLMLVALGLAIVFGLMRVINMAHGEFVMLGAYTVLTVAQAGGGYWLGFLCAPVVVGAVGLAVEELVIRRVYTRVLDSILATWGLSLLLQQAVRLLFGPGSHSVAVPLDMQVALGGFEYPLFRLFVMGVSALTVAATFWLFFGTNFGLRARAVIARREMASCLGIDTRRLDRFTFAYGAALAGLAGATLAPLISIDPQLGLGYLVPAFLAILVGGLGSVVGPLFGATGIGTVDSLIARLYSPVWAQVAVFVFAILVIRMFPQGIRAEREREV